MKKLSVLKWVAGILASIVASLAVWFLTQSGYGPIAPRKPNLEPTLQILNVSLQPNDLGIPSGTEARIAVTVHNSGDGVAEHCRIKWDIYMSPSWEVEFPTKTDLDRREVIALAQSADFFLLPEQTQEVNVAYIFKQSAPYQTRIRVTCKNNEVFAGETYPVSVYTP